MRVALLSDLHANLVALDAVLASVAREGVDQLICLGDVATPGPRPHEVLARLRELRCPAVLGNHDEFLLEPALIDKYTEAPIIRQSVDWCRSQLRADEVTWLRGMHRTLDLELGDGVSLALFHGSPRSHMEDLLATTPAEALEEALGPRRATVMAGGHTHIQMLRQHRGTLLLNPGSVGMPFCEHVAGRPPTILPHAEYATVESRDGQPHVALHRVSLDVEALRAHCRTSDVPLKGMLLAQYG